MAVTDPLEVELVEDEPVERASTPRRLLLVLGVALVVAALAWVVTARAQAAARSALLADRGFARSLADPWRAAWTAPALSPVLDDGAHLVGTSGERLSAVDLTDGQVLWTLNPGGDCVPVVGGEVTRAVGPVAARGADARLWCQLRGDQATDVVLDPADGSEVARLVTPGTPLLATVLDGDVVRLAALDGRLTWQRWSLAGAMVWQGATTDAVFGEALPTVSLEAGGAYATVTATRTVVVDLAAGVEVDPALIAIGGTEDRRVVSRSIDLPGGGRAEERTGTGLLPEVVAVAADGAVRWSTSGDLARPARDDGSQPDLVLVRSGGVLLGLDAGTGQRRWSFTESVSPAALAAGVLVAQGSGEVLALDLADGEVLWRVPLAGAERVMVLAGTTVTSDGTLVLAQDGTRLTARGLRDGQPRWQVGLPDGSQWSAVLSDGTLVIGGPAEISALR